MHIFKGIKIDVFLWIFQARRIQGRTLITDFPAENSDSTASHPSWDVVLQTGNDFFFFN